MQTAASTFRPNPAFDCTEVITTLGTGEALVSMLEGKGAPSIVERTLIRPPSGRIGPVSDAERRAVINASPVAGLYDQTIDRESAYEILTERARKAAAPQSDNAGDGWTLPGFGGDSNKTSGRGRSGYQRETIMEAALKSVARTVATQVGRALVRGILGSLKR